MKKISKIDIHNFAGISSFTANLSEGVSYIVASNASGKSTIGVTSIIACMKGVAERGDVLKGERRLFVGAYDDKAVISIVIKDADCEYTVTRKISEKGNELEIVSSDGRKLDQVWLNSFFSSIMLNPMGFTRLNPREQAVTLGIDVSEYDKEIQEIKEEASFLRREVKNFGEIEIPEKVEAVDVSELNKEKNDMIAFNKVQSDRAMAITQKEEHVRLAENEVERLMQQLQVAKVALDNRKRELRELPEPCKGYDTAEIDQKISEASDSNSKAFAYQAAMKKQLEKDAKQAHLELTLELQHAAEDRRIEYMKTLDLPFDNLTINDEGGLLMNGRPLMEPYFSTGERIKYATMLLSSRQKPEALNYVFIEAFDLLDEKNGRDVLDFLLTLNMQVIAEKVSRKSGENILILADDAIHEGTTVAGEA